MLQKLYTCRLTATDKKFVLASLDAMLDSILSFQREGEKEKKEKVPTKKAIEKAAAKAAEDATTKAATGAAAGATDADEKPADKSTETVIGPEPEVKEVAAGSVVASEPAPEESLPQIAEPKEAEAIVSAVVELGCRGCRTCLKRSTKNIFYVGGKRVTTWWEEGEYYFTVEWPIDRRTGEFLVLES